MAPTNPATSATKTMMPDTRNRPESMARSRGPRPEIGPNKASDSAATMKPPVKLSWLRNPPTPQITPAKTIAGHSGSRTRRPSSR
jgi:hypothetical protein